jgi:hypothetical protein
VACAGGWQEVGQLAEREAAESQDQGDRVAQCEANLAKQGQAIEVNQKHGLDQLTMFKKSQSEGLLRQFDRIEQRIEEERGTMWDQAQAARAELERRCRGQAKEVKTFVRDKNLELNTAQHEGYRELRAVRGGMEETAAAARREVRDCTAEGREHVRRLAEDEVGPAVAITAEYRGRVGELDLGVGYLEP